MTTNITVKTLGFCLITFFTLALGQQLDAQSRPKYRTLDGTLNNLRNPEFGKTGIPFFRELPAEYADGKNTLAGLKRPSPRLISNKLSDEREDVHNDRYMAGMFYSWGQFIDHDMTLAKAGTESMPIPLPSDEKRFSSPIPFKRSAPHAGTGVSSPRDQTNLTTSWIDASQVYGNNPDVANWLRTFKEGKLKVSSGNFLPFNTLNGEYDSPIDPNAPRMDDDNGKTVRTFIAGDSRANEHPVLNSFHTLFVREHNRICENLKSSGLSDEVIYQKARKQVGALIQVVTFGQWIASVGVNLSPYSGYREGARPDIRNTFATAAYRWHTMVENDIIFRDNECHGVGPVELPLKEVFNMPSIVRKNGIGVLLKGISVHRQYETDLKVNNGLRNFLFGPGSGLDLVAINLQRGRDHGLPNYNKVREFYTGKVAKNFKDIAEHDTTAKKMESLYGNVNNIDLWAGLFAEKRLDKKSVGKTVDAILRVQFECLRDGDFYYFENDSEFSYADRSRLKSTTLRDIIERNTEASNFQDNVFFVKSCSSSSEFNDIAHRNCNVIPPQYEGWTFIGKQGAKTYYKWNGGAANFEDAKDLVLRLGGHLPQINNATENNALKSYLAGGSTWLDINLIGKDWKYSNTFNASDIVVNGIKSPYFNWAKGEPNNVGRIELRAQILASGQWNDVPETILQTVIAEVPCENLGKTKLAANETLTMEAHAQPNRALIEWVNNTGYKNDYFTLEKANKKTGEFEKLLIVNNTSKDNEAIHYTAYDNTPDEGENTYRLKVTYQDGITTLSEIKTLVFKGLSGIFIYPNPSNDVMNIDLSNYKNQAVDVYLYNYFGQTVLVKKVDKVDNSLLELNIGDQPTGNYRVRVQSKGRKDVTQSVVIMH